MTKTLADGKITSGHIDLLMKAYQGGVPDAEDLLRNIADSEGTAFSKLEGQTLDEAQRKAAEIENLVLSTVPSSVAVETTGITQGAGLEEDLRDQLLELVQQDSLEPFQAVIGDIEKRVKGGRATSEDFLKLAELNALGLPVQDLISKVAQMKSPFIRTSPIDSFLDKVEEDIKTGKLTSEPFRTLALLAAHGNERALIALRGLSTEINFFEAFSREERESGAAWSNKDILEWAVEAVTGEQASGDPPSEFYERYINSPLNIPSEKPLIEIMAQAFKDGRITSKHIDLLMKAYQGGVAGATGLLMKIANSDGSAYEKVKDPIKKDAARLKVEELKKNFPRNASFIKLHDAVRGQIDKLEESDIDDLGEIISSQGADVVQPRELDLGNSLRARALSLTSSRSSDDSLEELEASRDEEAARNPLEGISNEPFQTHLYTLDDSFEEAVPMQSSGAADDLFSVIATTMTGIDPLNQRSSGVWSSLPTFKVSSNFIQRMFGRVDTKAIAGQVEEFVNEKVDSQTDRIKEQGKAAFSNLLEDADESRKITLKPKNLLANQDSARALLGLIGEDQYEPLIGLLTEIDGWINEMKAGADRTKDKAAIEKMAVDVLSGRLGELLFGDGVAVEAKVGLTKDAMAKFLVQDRATILKIAREKGETV